MAQTYKDFEVIAINDGSTDNSLRILQDMAAKDERITVIDQPNQGLVKTLNTAASLARGKYLARMDPDDISLPDRFELQVKELEARPETVLVAGCFEVFDDDGEYIYREVLPSNDRDIKRALYVRNPIAHGSVMMRKDAFERAGGYSSECGPTEDYELWTRMASLGSFASIDRTIFRWRVNPSGITSTKQKYVEHHMRQNLDKYWEAFPPSVLSRKELFAAGMDYFRAHKKHGAYMKHKLAQDNIQIGVKIIRRRRFGAGIKQLLNVASTGRVGAKLTMQKIWVISSNLVKNRGIEKPEDMLPLKPGAHVVDRPE